MLFVVVATHTNPNYHIGETLAEKSQREIDSKNPNYILI